MEQTASGPPAGPRPCRTCLVHTLLTPAFVFSRPGVATARIGWRWPSAPKTSCSPRWAFCILALPMLLIALFVRLSSPGPVLFRQQRTGRGGAPFFVLKFRTMYFEPEPDHSLSQAIRRDPRVTWFGALLRRTSLDELPQLCNVLRGEMSLVGPRPHAPATRAGGRLFDEVVPSYAARHRIRPGLTGLAQVRGLRGETDTEDKLVRRVQSDLEYIENWSVSLDLLILFRTAFAVLTMRNAY